MNKFTEEDRLWMEKLLRENSDRRDAFHKMDHDEIMKAVETKFAEQKAILEAKFSQTMKLMYIAIGAAVALGILLGKVVPTDLLTGL